MSKKNNMNREYLRPTQIGVEMVPQRTANEVNMLLGKYNYQEKRLVDNSLRLWTATDYDNFIILKEIRI